MVVAVCNILLALLFPAVQSARESANRLECANHLKQIGLAWQMHHDAHQHFPTGGWGWLWTGDPNRGYGEQQPGAWAFNILPYIDEQPLHDIGLGMFDTTSSKAFSTANVQRLATPVPLLYCPSRRAVALYPNIQWHPAANNCGDLTAMARGDYAANVGNPNKPVDTVNCGQWYCECNGGPPSLAAADNGSWSQWANTTAFNGISFQRSTVALRQVTDGTSYTAMVGEAYMNPNCYDTGTFGADNESIYAGFDDDLYKTTGFGPLQDALTNSDLFRFGSAHSSAFNMSFCDGSVRHIEYEIDTGVFSAFGSRAGGEIIDESKLNE
jgi:prepilin-type processing-associated H-X9-DG protein